MTLRRDAFPASPVNARLSWALRLALLLQCSPVSSHDIYFSRLNLQNVIFDQAIDTCWFEEAQLRNAKFNQPMKRVSFKKTDLREVYFRSFMEGSSIMGLQQAILSTDSFKALIRTYTLDFSEADLREVNFKNPQIKINLALLNFAKADLRSVDFSQLDLSYLILTGANLENANLENIFFEKTVIDAQTNLKGSQLSIYLVNYAYQKNIRNFDKCNIYFDMVFLEIETFFFSRASFKAAKFMGKILFVDFADCDLSEAGFNQKSVNRNAAEFIMDISIKIKKSQLNKVVFSHVNFLENSEFTESTLKNISFDNVKMQAKTLFKFYAAGQRDFKGVDDLKGAISQNLTPFPVLDAELNKQTFIHR
jgi:uncharacterized protein YjbI with pentapeptide repeats